MPNFLSKKKRIRFFLKKPHFLDTDGGNMHAEIYARQYRWAESFHWHYAYFVFKKMIEMISFKIAYAVYNFSRS